MIKKILLLSLVVAHLFLILVISLLFFLAEVYPFQPGDTLYTVQNAGEQAHLSLTGSRNSQANYALVLANRRLADLAQASTPEAVEAAVESFESALKTAAITLEQAPQGAHQDLHEDLEIILTQADVVVHALGDRVDMDLLQDLHSRVAMSQEADTLVEVKTVLVNQIAAEVVPFYPQDVDHSKFGLFGGHYRVDCMSCHQGGEYISTTDDCSSCHQPKVYQKQLPEVYGNLMIAHQNKPIQLEAAYLYPDHYAGECSDCHSIYSWDPVAFDHSSVFECQSCHEQDLPADKVENGVLVQHYPGDCKDCHSSYTDWTITEFGHEGVRECASCHSELAHGDCCEDTCSNCHEDVTEWSKLSYDHSGKTDCASCHSLDEPQNHYQGQCEECHSTESWAYGVFNHPSGANCSSCHQVPADHYRDNCSSCHNPSSSSWEKTVHTTNQNCSQCHETPDKHYVGADCSTCHSSFAWEVSSYNHDVGTAACQDCHTENAPVAHYDGDCQDCHNTSDWSSYVIDHTYYTDCQDCHQISTSHYPGVCSDCHITTDWIVEEVDHTYMYDCLSCHETPTGHWPGQCSSCHVVNEWEEINFDHVTYTDCKACHMRPADHPRGQCSNCHTTEYWIEPTATPDPTLPSGPDYVDGWSSEDEDEDRDTWYGLPPIFVPNFTPKPTSTPVVSDVRATPTPQVTQDPRETEPTPTPDPSEDPGDITTPIPDPIDPNPEPAPTPDAEVPNQAEPLEESGQAMEVMNVADVPKEEKLVLEAENPTDQEDEDSQELL